MSIDRGHIEHHPVVGHPAAEGEVRAVVVFDMAGRKIGSSPHVLVEQVSRDEADGVVTTTLKFTPLKDA